MCFRKPMIIFYILIALMSIGLSHGDDVNTEAIGLRFDLNQTVEGFGIASSYRCMESMDMMLHSHNSGSGASSHESRSYVRNDDIVEGSLSSFTENKSVGLHEIVSAAYSPTKLDYPGSFRSGPIKSLWSDSIFMSAGDQNVSAMKASFYQLQAFEKETTATLSSAGYYEELTHPLTSGSFAESMKLKAVFNGSAQIGANFGSVNGEGSDVLLDEYYRGSFTISKKMNLGIKSSITQEEDEWLPCCSGGWTSMNLEEKGSFPVDVKRVFDCTCSASMALERV